MKIMQSQGNNRFWDFKAAADGLPAELILYGDIASSSWWGDEITPRQFSDELNALGAVSEIVVRINSGGGDVFAANAIYTRLKDHKAKITVKIDGWAASAATIVAMAGDVIEIPANGVFMVHKARMGLMGYYGDDDMTKMAEEIKIINQSIVNGYALKTKKDPDAIATIMAEETWYDGKSAVEAGFCDKIMFEDVETQVENSSKIVINSVAFDLTRFSSIPTSLLNRCTSRPDNSFANTDTQNNKNTEKESENMIFTTVEELQAAFPALVKQIADSATAAERKRIQDIEGVALSGFDSLVNAAKFESPLTAGELATKIVAEQKKQGAAYLANRAEDAEKSGVNAAGTSGQEGVSDDSDTGTINAAIDKVLPAAK